MSSPKIKGALLADPIPDSALGVILEFEVNWSHGFYFLGCSAKEVVGLSNTPHKCP